VWEGVDPSHHGGVGITPKNASGQNPAF